MTAKEIIGFLKNISAMFPNEKAQSMDDMQTRAAIWGAALKDVSYERAMEALVAYCSAAESGFAPQPAHILNYLRDKNRINDSELRLMLRRAIADSTYNSEKRFNALPCEIREIVGSPAELVRQAQRSCEDTDIYIMGVAKQYKKLSDTGVYDDVLLLGTRQTQMLTDGQV